MMINDSLQKDLRYLVFGTGALGSVFGGFLQLNGFNVTYVGLGKHFESILNNGLKITGIWGDHFIPSDKIEGYLDYSQLKEKFDVILLCVKSNHTESAVNQAKTLLKEEGIIVSIQNGLGNVEIMAKYISPEKIIGGRIIFGVENMIPGVVNVSVYADKVLFGFPFVSNEGNNIPHHTIREKILESVVASLNSSQIPTSYVSSDEIIAKIWEKTLYNSALNPLGALLEVKYGELGNNEYTFNFMKNILKEIFDVIKRKGIKVSYTFDEYFKFFLKKQLPPTRNHHSSMLQDILNGNKTEIDALNGAISLYAEELNIKTPYNDILVQLIKAKESME